MATSGDNDDDYYYEEENEVDWVLDSITEFLKSPVWRNPIKGYIDEHCIVFDDEEENKLEYTDIHNGFKKIVDEQLDRFIKDFGIESDIFVTACAAASQRVHKGIVNQLLAVENFPVFKKMMITRNKQLNEEALQQLKEGGDTGHEDLEEQMAREREEAELAQAIAESQALEEKRQLLAKESQQIDTQPQAEQPQLTKPSALESGLPSIGQSYKASAQGFEDINIDEESKQKQEHEIQDRQQRLKIQRDILLKKKAEEREKEVQDYQNKQANDKSKSEEEEKSERIKKGLAALNLAQSDQQKQEVHQEKRKNLMHEIRDALIAGDVEDITIKKVKKRKQQEAQP